MSNKAHNRPAAVDEPELPADLQHVADTLNAWHEAFQGLRPGAVTFRADVVDVIRGGERETGVQLWAMRPTGVSVDTVPPALARELAGLLLEKARQAETGLEVIRNGKVTP